MSKTITPAKRYAHIIVPKALNRRTLLRAAGAGIALPLLDAMTPALAKTNHIPVARRFVGICHNIGVLAEHFFPKDSGKNYTPSHYLSFLAKYKNDFTVFSGVSHPDVDGGHPADVCFLSAAAHPSSGGFRNSISLDQAVAEHTGHLTRFPSLTLGVNVDPVKRSLSYTRSGAKIPCENSASALYKRLFIQGSEEQITAQVRKLERGQSILDAVAEQTKKIERKVGHVDRERIDQYYTSVRELERRMKMSKAWAYRPLPKTKAVEPVDPMEKKDYMAKIPLMYDMISLAIQTDSTRSISLLLDAMYSPAIEFTDVKSNAVKFTGDYHLLSHHGKSEEKKAQLQAADEVHMTYLNTLYSSLQAIKEQDQTLLDKTIILYGSNMTNAHTHDTSNLPILFAGGGFKHGQHLAFNTERNYPLPNLFVSTLQRMGIETDRFASSTGSMRGLEMT